MKADNYIEKFGILLKDVLNSREKALERGGISNTSDYVCFRCGNTKLEEFYASNSDRCWKNLCGVGGMCVFCPKCMDIVEFRLMAMS